MKKNWAGQSYENGWNKKTRPPRKVPGWTKCCLLKSINHGKDMKKNI
jgi:hypothetical protein